MAGDEDQRMKAPKSATARGDGTEEQEDRVALLPDDVLADVLRRVPPRWLAASRCVSRAWRDAVDGRRLLRADLLPLSLAGLFVHFDDHKFPEFFARPSSSAAAGARAVSGDLSFLPSASPHCGYPWQDDLVDWGDYAIVGHCNGLLLLRGNYVVNPATRRWHTLPACPTMDVVAGNVQYGTHLVYDSMVSPYHEVFKIPTLYRFHPGDEVDPSFEESEWPPSRCKMHVFSPKSGYWEEKNFLREGDAAGTVWEMRNGLGQYNAVYFRGALYLHCRPNFLLRVSLSNNTYHVIKSPMDTYHVIEPPTDLEGYCPYQVVKSKKGVYFVSVDKYWPQDKCWLQVWILNESCRQTEWMLKHDKDLKPLLRHQPYGKFQWILEDINYNMFRSCPEDNKKAACEKSIEWISDKDVKDEDMVDQCYLEDNKKSIVEKKLEWNSNDHNVINNGNTVEEYFSDDKHFSDEEHINHFYDDIQILGFHPYKEIVFLSASEQTGLAYHLNSSKIENLGNIYPKEYLYFKELANEREKIEPFPYTSCWIEKFPVNS